MELIIEETKKREEIDAFKVHSDYFFAECFHNIVERNNSIGSRLFLE